ncbi:MAG: hypothetical protein A2142_00330 [candidate division Zixibacteria bacterium RBG_16_48_11]|nr:MAG: hypothetical protein A2142_00330 [candidate division Zixibacteria bacterium RBG_16_48_11]
MRVAAIDIGTNSVLLTVAELSVSGRLKPVYEAQKITRLGQGTDQSKSLSQASMDRTLSVIRVFQGRAKKLGVQKIWAVGTSALRMANNRKVFQEKIQTRTGLKLEIISGKKEAKLGLKGALVDLHLSKSKITLLDLGGGSTEVSLAKRGTPLRGISLDLGAVRLTEKHFRYNVVTQSRLQSLLEDASTSWRKLEKWNLQNSELVGTGGTVTTLAALDLNLTSYQSEKVHGHILTIQRVQKFLHILGEMTLSRRKKYLRLDPKRADIIVAGTAILFSFLQHFKFRQIRVSDKGLRWGVILTKLGLN